MSDPNRPASRPENGVEKTANSGPNLRLIYGLMLLALLVAIVVAAFIVLPFYQRR